MSVANETGNIEAYRKLRYVEFLDLLCRATVHIFKEMPVNAEKLTFDRQLELVLDLILWKAYIHRSSAKLNYMGPAPADSSVEFSHSENDNEDMDSEEQERREKIKKTK